eukprot:CAMPEP_0203996414 /NCGR_PEP_ID=MMETSP0360-20130528/12712_1 /ASSEMBLY_ACC=CAM_ASM_000342 /TAXON_ID=268821 /ORGANISM="Scrippsiella Hangoei, Strain SHTV-5" /LENGTH=71 /DNA_ID=CAMNT_0050937217 /DNA_START=103 /DNA_END=314 /DNA_ORIENTATION=+
MRLEAACFPSTAFWLPPGPCGRRSVLPHAICFATPGAASCLCATGGADAATAVEVELPPCGTPKKKGLNLG